MSQENVALWRASIEDFLAGTREPNRERMLAKLAELWDPDIEWDASESPLLDLAEVYRGIEAVRRQWFEFLGLGVHRVRV